MLPTHAVGIDLGTTYSTIAYLNEHGEPVTLPNPEGELSTPSVVLFENGQPIVGTEALRNAIVHPKQVVQHAKRFMGNAEHRWIIDGRPYTPIDISAIILKHLLAAAREQIGEITQAVITVPAQFSEAQRMATIEAGHRAGLNRVDVINEPVAAALCHVLGTEGLWFTELADAQQILVFDLGGGTLDLSLVRYTQEKVAVVGSDGDLQLGGLDWNAALLNAIGDQFTKEFKLDPRHDPESLQYLSNEVEQAKRALSVREKTALSCQHAGHRRSYQIDRAKFEKLTKSLVDKTEQITKRLLKTLGIGWARVDVVLTTGGASRMPMIRDRLKQLSGRTLNTSLSPDLSIAHGATYYAGMLLSNDKFASSILSSQASERLTRMRQSSVNARPLGLMVRTADNSQLEPHFLIPANTTLPAEVTQQFGTVIPNQKRVRLNIVEGGLQPDQKFVRLGDCVIDDLPQNLPEGSEIAVTIRYDEQARVHVRARDVASGKEASAEILRHENVKNQLQGGQIAPIGANAPKSEGAYPLEAAGSVKKSRLSEARPATSTESRSSAAGPSGAATSGVPSSGARSSGAPSSGVGANPQKSASGSQSAQDPRSAGEEEFWRSI